MSRKFPSDRAAVLAGEIADLIGEAARRIRIRSREALTERDVSWAQLRALRACSRSAEPMRMSELADRLGIARRSATSVVDELERRGLVERRPDPTDRRGVAVAVTAAGRSALAELDGARRAVAAQLAVEAELSGAELVALRDLLARVVDGPTTRAGSGGR